MDDELDRLCFEYHCSVADGSYLFMQYVTAHELLRSQSIASAGYEAYLQMQFDLARDRQKATAGS